jgi:hypothetical protein
LEFLNDNGDDAAVDDLDRSQFLFFMKDEIATYCVLTTEPQWFCVFPLFSPLSFQDSWPGDSRSDISESQIMSQVLPDDNYCDSECIITCWVLCMIITLTIMIVNALLY